MAGTKITYNGDAERITWYGQDFERGKAIETDNEALIDAARRNSFFTTAGLADKETAEEVKAQEEARKAAEAQAQADAEEEQRRALELNAAYAETDDGDDEGADPAVSSEPAAPRRGRPPKNG